MANALFTKFKEHLGLGDVDLLADNLKIVLVDETVDIPVPGTDEYLSDIAAGARVATSGNLAGKTFGSAIFNANSVTLVAVAGPAFQSIVLYQDTGVEATSILIAYFDTGTNLPYIPDGGNITVTWPTGASKIFQL